MAEIIEVPEEPLKLLKASNQVSIEIHLRDRGEAFIKSFNWGAVEMSMISGSTPRSRRRSRALVQ
jgi:hypothetical protein